ncbi:MAG: hypothetical protein ACLFRG_05010, partial [Desulfococcaceae bacterium]
MAHLAEEKAPSGSSISAISNLVTSGIGSEESKLARSKFSTVSFIRESKPLLPAFLSPLFKPMLQALLPGLVQKHRLVLQRLFPPFRQFAGFFVGAEGAESIHRSVDHRVLVLGGHGVFSFRLGMAEHRKGQGQERERFNSSISAISRPVTSAI